MPITPFTRGAVVVGALLVASGAWAAPPADSAAPTFAKDVAPILYRSCIECHRPTMFAPMSLVTYEEVRPWARSIKQKVMKGEMPPWHAEGPAGVFKNDPRLSPEEIATIARWADTGAARGNDADMPKLPALPAEGWTIG